MDSIWRQGGWGQIAENRFFVSKRKRQFAPSGLMWDWQAGGRLSMMCGLDFTPLPDNLTPAIRPMMCGLDFTPLPDNLTPAIRPMMCGFDFTPLPDNLTPATPPWIQFGVRAGRGQIAENRFFVSKRKRQFAPSGLMCDWQAGGRLSMMCGLDFTPLPDNLTPATPPLCYVDYFDRLVVSFLSLRLFWTSSLRLVVKLELLFLSIPMV